MYCNNLYCWELNCAHEGAPEGKTDVTKDRVKGALYGLLIADALAMPYSSGGQVDGKIEGYVAAAGGEAAGNNSREGLVVRQVVKAGGKLDLEALGDAARSPLLLVPVALSGQAPAAAQLDAKYGQVLAQMLRDIVFDGKNARKVIEEGAKALGVDLPPYSSADPPAGATDSFRAVLFVAAKYAAEGEGNSMAQNMARGEAFLNGVFANVNRPHESQTGATEALVGALLGGACGFDNLPRGLIEGLAQRATIDAEVATFLKNLP